MPEPDVSLAEYARFEQFTLHLQESGRSANTLRAYRLDWTVFATWFAHVNDAPFDLAHLSALDVRDYLSWGKQEGLKPATLNRRLGFLKLYVQWGEEQAAVGADQVNRIKQIGIVKRQSLAPKSLTSQQVRKLLKEVEVRGNLRDRAIIYTLLYTGLRVGELVSLTRADIRLSDRKGTITVRAAVAKGGKERQVPVPKLAREALSSYLAATKPTDGVFIGRQGVLSEAGVAAMVAKYGDLAKLERVTPHVLRHTFAYNYLVQNNNDLVALADILGHSSLLTTQIYTKRRLDDLQSGIDRVQFF